MRNSSFMFFIFERIKLTVMKNHKNSLIIILMIFFIASQNSFAQPVVGIDNWFNRETNAKTGKPFHYLWTDTEWSGYSRWGEIFIRRGAKIITVAKPETSVLDGAQ